MMTMIKERVTQNEQTYFVRWLVLDVEATIDGRKVPVDLTEALKKRGQMIAHNLFEMVSEWHRNGAVLGLECWRLQSKEVRR